MKIDSMKVIMYAAATGSTLAGAVVLAGVARFFGVDWTTVDFIADVMPWFMSAITLYMTFLQGNKDWRAWLWGLLNQGLWLVFVIHGEHWGLLPLNIGLWYLYIRNFMKWLREDNPLPKQQEPPTDWQRFYASTDEMKKKPW